MDGQKQAEEHASEVKRGKKLLTTKLNSITKAQERAEKIKRMQ